MHGIHLNGFGQTFCETAMPLIAKTICEIFSYALPHAMHYFKISDIPK